MSASLAFTRELRESINNNNNVIKKEGPLQVPAADIKVGIIGAGASGLYAALMLQEVGVKCEIFEAHPERVGGRLFTYKFSDDEVKTEADAKEDLNYVDMGAMRFPDIPIMKPLEYLEKYLNLQLPETPIKRDKYNLSDKNSLSYYNGIRRTNEYEATAKESGFHFHGTGSVPDRYQDMKASDVLNMFLRPFKEALRKDFGAGFRTLLTAYDSYSTRSFLQTAHPELYDDELVSPLPTSVINWLEAVGSSSGLFDMAWSETVIDSLDFDYNGDMDKPQPDIEWWLYKGGASQLAEKMKDVILKKDASAIKLNHRVTKIAPAAKLGKVALTIDAPKDQQTTNPKEFDYVICTLPLGALANVDTSACDLSFLKRTAIRSLQYDHSCKIAIRFRERWWQDNEFMTNPDNYVNGRAEAGGKSLGPINGGQSTTDLPIRKIVYPTRGGVHDAAILIVSYTWAQDAARSGGLMAGKQSNGLMRSPALSDDERKEENLITLSIDNLAAVHGLKPKILHDLRNLWKSEQDQKTKEPKHQHFCYNWHSSPYSCGAFALYGPSQFRRLYKDMAEHELNGSLHFCGEAVSTHHAWVVGSLNSAYRNVREIFGKIGVDQNVLKDTFPVPQEISEKVAEPPVGTPKALVSHTNKLEEFRSLKSGHFSPSRG